MNTNNLVIRSSLALAAWLAAALLQPNSAAAFECRALPGLPDVNICGDVRLLVEDDELLYTLDGSLSDVALDDLGRMTLLFVLTPDLGMFLTEIEYPGQGAPTVPTVVIRPIRR